MPEAAELLLWAKGFAAGFAIAAPLGPTAILCIRRTLDHGRLFGFATGLAAAIADAVLGAVAAYGLMQLSRIGGWLERALLFVLGPVAAAFVHLFVSPKREFAADRAAAALCGSPHGLADALIAATRTTPHANRPLRNRRVAA